MSSKISDLVLLLEKQNETLAERERELNEKAEELEAQKEELTAAIEELVKQNNFLNATLAELKERNEELDQLVYRTSHDLKTPITSTLGMLNLLYAEKPSSTVREYADRIGASMQKMNDVLRSVALFTKASLEAIQQEKIALPVLIQKAWDSLSYVEGHNQVNFQLAVESTVTLQSDPILLLEAFKAVLVNAIHFRRSQDAVLRVTTSRSENWIYVSMEDNGEGMTSEVMENAFAIFYRGSEKSKGSGLGLYMVKKILTRVGGTVRLECPTEGVVVHFSIPDDL